MRSVSLQPLLVCLGALILAACGGDESLNDVDQTGFAGIAVPRGVSDVVRDRDGRFAIEIYVDDRVAATYDNLTVVGNRVGSPLSFQAGTGAHQVYLKYYIVLGSSRYWIAQSDSFPVTVSGGQQSATMGAVRIQQPLPDDDKDGVTNLNELQAGTDPNLVDVLGVRRSVPANGATDVARNPTITLEFVKPINGQSIRLNQFSLKAGNQPVELKDLRVDGAAVNLVFDAVLQANTLYTVAVTGAVVDRQGQTWKADFGWSFTTGVQDPPPQVTRIVPTADATDVALNTMLTVEFSEPMDPNSIQLSDFSLKAGDQEVSLGRIEQDSAKVNLFTNEALQASTEYLATVATSVSDLQGQSLPEPFSWRFTTSPPPQVTRTIPAADVADVELNTALVVEFSEPMDRTSIDVSDFSLEAIGQRIAPGSVMVDGATVTLIVSGGLRTSADYVLTVAATVADLQGQTLTQPFTWRFSTKAPAVPVFQDTLQDGTRLGPKMVVIPPGQFTMGSPDTEAGRAADEGPLHRVTLAKPFALSQTEVTFEDYDRFAEATSKAPPADLGKGRGTRPVINVSWDDANAYAAWLAEQTGKKYRLPSEAEWEYAARAGAGTPRYWGSNPGSACRYANIYDDALRSENLPDLGSPFQCNDRVGSEPAPVGQYQPNAFGLHDMLGNVWEWTQDCWHGNYVNAPNDGSAWLDATSGDCGRRAQRGGAWSAGRDNARSADRFRSDLGVVDAKFGIRLAQDLTEFQDTLVDKSRGPAMVVIPAGSFTMGSPSSETGRQLSEGPLRTVTLAKSFAMGKTEITFNDYDRFAKATQRELPDDQGWGRDNRPVMSVTRTDAQAYAAWLSEQTGRMYRLPSEAEWEYAARAGSTTARHWGEEPDLACTYANVADETRGGNVIHLCNDGVGNENALAGQYQPNAFGLYDMMGNVWEWIQDCWHGDYAGAPSDGRAWIEGGDCSFGVIRGGSRSSEPNDVRSASRKGWPIEGNTSKNNNRGFRLVLDF